MLSQFLHISTFCSLSCWLRVQQLASRWIPDGELILRFTRPYQADWEWYMMILDDIWWYLMIFDDISNYIKFYPSKWWESPLLHLGCQSLGQGKMQRQDSNDGDTTVRMATQRALPAHQAPLGATMWCHHKAIKRVHRNLGVIPKKMTCAEFFRSRYFFDFLGICKITCNVAWQLWR
jgi:hypothetical protein